MSATKEEYWHGTTNGYNNRGCRCDPCRKAASAMQKKRRHERGCDEEGCSNVWQTSYERRYLCSRHLRIARGR